MKLLSIESQRLRYLSLNSGLMRTAVKTKIRSRSTGSRKRRTLALAAGRGCPGMIASLQAIELAMVAPSPAVDQILGEQHQDGAAIDRALEKRGRGSLREVPRRHRNFGDAHAQGHHLGHDFLVEDELVGVGL